MPLPENNLLFGLAPRLTPEQREYVDAIFDYQLVMVNAKAGTGKTTLAVACAKILKKPLIYIFNPVQEAIMGFRPGTQSEKESIYHQPLIDALLEINENPVQCIYNEEVLANEAIRRKVSVKRVMDGIWCYPKSPLFLRGTNLKDMTIIIDECQNFTAIELRKIFTRVHDSCKVICIGHSGQTDIPSSKSGFVPYMEHFKDQPYCKIITLSKNFRGELANWADKFQTV
ncbi:PhoH family protein [Desulfosporosinus acidiphilus SJ4]|uniref:PhoH family protein n=1 Tax=Desulfosporosinus acidiphilus (strain DSM 22704 / JCM 16185 / SJ4) TaxID=646529 RepID=I4D552_DESAJ|nr:PhoH family protein [Desulfosporosinus acidiphilus]AFM40926.1 PhoH family protein [Desulfosporosinus acidiphilus SJ4]